MCNRLIFILLIVMVNICHGQTKETIKPAPTEKKKSVSLGINIPVGNFSATHIAGFAAEYSPAQNWLGKLNAKKIVFTYNGGIAYYFGKKEIVSNYPYKYPGYTFIHAFGGLLYNPFKKTGISLTAGPALGIYNGNLQFNMGTKLEASYNVSTSIAIGPGILLIKEPGANALWSLAIRAGIKL